MDTEKTPVDEMTREQLEVAGRDEIHRFLGNPTGQAHDMARDLTDDELKSIIAAGADRHTARGAIKDVFARAYDRKREAHEKQAKEDQERLKGNTTRATETADNSVATDPYPPAE